MRKNNLLRIAVLMLCVSMMTALFCLNVSAASGITLTVDSVTASPGDGDTVNVAIKITSNPGGLSSLIMSVSYNTSAFELTSSSNGSVLSSMTAGKNHVFYDGSGSSETGTLVTLTFKVKSPAAFGTYNITVTVHECCDINENDITASVTAGKITLECAHKNTKSVSAVSATCVDKGYTAGVYCNDCATYISGHKEVAATGNHTYVTSTVNKAPTCTEKGNETKTCTVCKKTVTEDVAAKGHTEVTDKGVAATCTEGGVTDGIHCSVCNTVIKTQTEVAALGHNRVTDSAKAPTCTKTGLTEGSSCSRCGEVYVAQETIPALGHTEVKDSSKAPTCTETGLTEGSHCSVCNAVVVKQNTVSATGHKYGDWVVVKDATETEAGEKTRTCEQCDDTVTEEIPMISVDPDDTTDDTDDTTDESDDTTDDTDGTSDNNAGETTDDGNGEETVGNGGEGTDDGDEDGKCGWICWLIILLLILLVLAAVYYIRKKMKENKKEK